MELYQIRYFLALCESLNFTRAAESCHVTQPTLTRGIKLLEEQLGGPLFHRERNRTHPTELGRNMRPYFERVYADTLEAKKRARRIVEASEASLRIGATNSIATTRIMGIFTGFQRRFPGVELHLTDAPAESLCSKLSGGGLDCALYSSPEPEPPEFHALPLFRSRIMVGFCRGHRFENKPAVRMSDLAGERYLVREGGEHAPYFDQLFKDSAVVLGGRYRSPRDNWLNAMASVGLGFCFLPEDPVGRSDLVLRPLVEPELELAVSLLTVKGRPHSAALAAFVREAQRYTRSSAVSALAS